MNNSLRIADGIGVVPEEELELQTVVEILGWLVGCFGFSGPLRQ